jgi:hypothetical protein
MRPIFYAASNDRVMVSDSLAAMIPRLEDQSLDCGALAVFLRLGFFLGNDTAFSEVRAFPPGGRLHWDGMLKASGERPVVRPTTLTFDQAVDAYIDLFRQSIGRRRPESGAVRSLPLSGGRDSRHIALELHAQRCAVSEYVTISRDWRQFSADVSVAQIVAGYLGGQHVVIEPAGPLLDWQERHNLLTHFAAYEHAWIAPVFAYLAKYCAHSLDGIGGDVLSAGLFNSGRRSRLASVRAFDELASNILQQWSPPPSSLCLLENLLGIRVHQDDVLQRIATTLAEFGEEANPVAAFYFWNRTRRKIALAPFGLGRGTRQDAPFIDRDLFDALASFPAAWSLDGRLHDAVLARAYREFSSFMSEVESSVSRRPLRWVKEHWLGRTIRRTAVYRSLRTWRVGQATSQIDTIQRALLVMHLRRLMGDVTSGQRGRLESDSR